MPYQPFNYAGIEPQGYPGMRNLIDNLVKGYKAGQMPKESQLQQDYIAAQTANQRGLAGEKELMNQYLKQYLPANGQQQGGLNNVNGNAKPSDVANAIFRKHFGIPEETVSEKSEREFEDFKRKEGYKAEQENLFGTTAFKTQQRTSQTAAEQAIEPIKNLMSRPSTGIVGQYWGGSDEKFLDTNALLAADNYMKAKNINPTVENLSKFHNLFRRGTNEDEKDYQARLANYLKDVQNLSGKKEDVKLRVTFSSKEDFDKYKNSLSVSDQMKLKEKLGL